MIGPNAYSQAALYGNYHGDSDEYITNLMASAGRWEIRSAFSTARAATSISRRTILCAGREDFLGEAEAVVKNSDVVILCVGLDERLEGEQGTRATPLPPATRRTCCCRRRSRF